MFKFLKGKHDKQNILVMHKEHACLESEFCRITLQMNELREGEREGGKNGEIREGEEEEGRRGQRERVMEGSRERENKHVEKRVHEYDSKLLFKEGRSTQGASPFPLTYTVIC